VITTHKANSKHYTSHQLPISIQHIQTLKQHLITMSTSTINNSQTQQNAAEQRQVTSQALDLYAQKVALPVDESQTQIDTTEQHNAPSQAFVLSTLEAALPANEDPKPLKTPSAASKVFNITELAEMILLKTDLTTLHTTAPQVSKDLQQTILGSVKLQRHLHKSPDWSQTKMSPAPLPQKFVTYTLWGSCKDGSFDSENAPTIEPNSQHILNLRFDTSAIAWACKPDRKANGVLRDMLICQPPVVAVEIYCWSAPAHKIQVEQHRIENENGVTCGQLFDLVQASEPIGGNVRLTWSFSDHKA
jgi:hypothetical protein